MNKALFQAIGMTFMSLLFAFMTGTEVSSTNPHTHLIVLDVLCTLSSAVSGFAGAVAYGIRRNL